MIRAGILIVLMAFVGCGERSTRPETAAVSGSVTVSGVPIEGANVSFMAQGSPRTAVGVTDTAGKFKLTTFDTNDGAVIGEHVITITKAAAPGSAATTMDSPAAYAKAMEGSKGVAPPSAKNDDESIPTKYANPAQSGLKRTVAGGEENVFNFELTP